MESIVYCHQRHEWAHDLIQTLHHAPSLERLVIENAKVTVSDLEDLHARATKLKHLGLDHLDIDVGDVENLAVHHPAKSLVSLSMEYIKSLREDNDEGRPLDNAIRNWIIYIGKKYPNLQDIRFDLHPSEHDLQQELMTNSLTTVLKNWKDLEKYVVTSCLPSKAVFDVLDSNDVQLTDFGFTVQRGPDATIAGLLNTVESTQSVQSVLSLKIDCEHRLSKALSPAISGSLTGLNRSLQFLTSLDIICTSDNGSILLAQMTQNLTLKTLKFYEARLDTIVDNDLFYIRFQPPPFVQAIWNQSVSLVM